MKKITLIRHAEASFAAINDFDRTLTINGQNQVRALAKELPVIWDQTNPSVFIYSGAKRTAETIKLLTEDTFQKVTCVSDTSIYEAPIKNYLTLINGLSDSLQHVVIVAHNPALTYLSQYLSGELVQFSPATSVDFQAEIESWLMVSQNLFSIQSIFTPKMF